MCLFRIGSLHAGGCLPAIWPQGCETFISVPKNPGAMKLQCGTKLIGRQLIFWNSEANNILTKELDADHWCARGHAGEKHKANTKQVQRDVHQAYSKQEL